MDPLVDILFINVILLVFSAYSFTVIKLVHDNYKFKIFKFKNFLIFILFESNKDPWSAGLPADET